jgi:hypothetical protein
MNQLPLSAARAENMPDEKGRSYRGGDENFFAQEILGLVRAK